jgi:hypothetical protein
VNHGERHDGENLVALAAARPSAGGLLAALAWASYLSAPAAAQVSIRVVDAGGAPVSAVRVDVYGRGEVLSTASTSGLGVAELSPERWSEARRLSLSHLGYQTLIVQVEDIPADGVIGIEPEAVPIDALSVDVGQLCPIVDESRARDLWSQVASLYATDTASRAWFAYLSSYGGYVREDGLFRASDSETTSLVAAGGPYDVLRSDLTSRGLDAQVSSDGYAWPPAVIDGTKSRGVGAWSYPELHQRAAHHFASRVFGAVHDFAVATEAEERVTLVFCGNERSSDRPTMNGAISLIPGRTFLGAEWRFETDEPDEGAGGSVTFGPFVDGSGSVHLVATRGLFYRHSGVEPPYPDLPRSFVRDVVTHVEWHLLPSGERPCNRGTSYLRDAPLTADSPGARLAACIARYWQR